MFDYQKIFDEYCRENGLALRLCVEIPECRKQFRIQNSEFRMEEKTPAINRRSFSDLKKSEE